MNLKNRFGVLAGALLVTGALVTGAAFASEAPATTAQPQSVESNTKASALTQAEQDVLTQLKDLRTSVMEKLAADSKALVDQAVKDGKITQEQADRLLKHGGHKFGGHKFVGKHGRGGKGGFFKFHLSQEELKAQLDAKVKEGKITQEQADQILQKFAERAKKTE